jgi:hypothetical protein
MLELYGLIIFVQVLYKNNQPFGLTGELLLAVCIIFKSTFY